MHIQTLEADTPPADTDSHVVPTIQEQLNLLTRFRKDPVFFFDKVLKVSKDDKGDGGLWHKQEEVLHALTIYNKIACYSGHSLGKDFIGGGLPLWWLSCYDDAIVIMTAPTDRQVEGIMWAELTEHYNRAGGEAVFGGRLITKKFSLSPKRFCLAFTTKESKSNGVGKAQGWHSPNILIIMSEAQAIDDEIYQQLDGITTAPNSKILLLGNPLRSTGAYAIASRGKEYHHIHMNCLDNPNYIQDRTVIRGLASRQWVLDMKEKHGEDSPVWQGRVLGIVPDCTIDAIISHQLARSRINTEVYSPFIEKRRILTIDPAGQGDDPCQYYVMEEGKIIHSITEGFSTAPIIRENAFHLVIKYKCHAVVGDKIGEGSGALEVLQEKLALFGIPVFYYKGSYAKEHLSKPETYLNLRAESMFEARDSLSRQHACFPSDEELLLEATEHTYFFNKKGLYQVIDKDTIKRSIGRSPNKWDAFVIGIWGLKRLGDITNKRNYRWSLADSGNPHGKFGGSSNHGNPWNKNKNKDYGNYGGK